MRIIALANHKGGVAKTATAHNLGAALAVYHAKRVLLVDLDPQASLTGACGIADEIASPDAPGGGRFLKQVFSLAEVLGGARPGQVDLRDVLVTVGDRLTVCPADSALAEVEVGLASRLGREHVLRKALEPVAGEFDACLLDCPPDQGLLTINALAAAHAVIVPSQPNAQDQRATQLFLEVIRQVKAEVNPALCLLGILLTFYDNRLAHHRTAFESLRQSGLPLFSVAIGRSVRVAEAAGAGRPVIVHDPHNPQSLRYRELADAVGEWLGNATA